MADTADCRQSRYCQLPTFDSASTAYYRLSKVTTVNTAKSAESDDIAATAESAGTTDCRQSLTFRLRQLLPLSLLPALPTVQAEQTLPIIRHC